MFFVLSRASDKEKFQVPTRNRTTELRIPRSDALPLSHRDSMVSKAQHVIYTLFVEHRCLVNSRTCVLLAQFPDTECVLLVPTECF